MYYEVSYLIQNILCKVEKCIFLNTNQILGKQYLPPKLRKFLPYQICDKTAKVTKYTKLYIRVGFKKHDFYPHLVDKGGGVYT